MEKTIRFLMQFENSAKVISQTLDGKIQTLNDITPELIQEYNNDFKGLKNCLCNITEQIKKYADEELKDI